jgi:hypothetical protein
MNQTNRIVSVGSFAFGSPSQGEAPCVNNNKKIRVRKLSSTKETLDTLQSKKANTTLQTTTFNQNVKTAERSPFKHKGTTSGN